MLLDTSKKSVVHCDICQDPMSKQANGWACYECKNWIDEFEQRRFDPESFAIERFIEQGPDGFYHYTRQFVLDGYPHYQVKLIDITPYEEEMPNATSGD